jgi:hypothetical protein
MQSLDAGIPPKPQVPRWAWALALAYAVFVLLISTIVAAFDIAGDQKAGFLEGSFHPIGSLGPVEYVIDKTTTGSGIVAAGLKAGDHFRFDRFHDATRNEQKSFKAGESIPLLVLRSGGQRQRILVTADNWYTYLTPTERWVWKIDVYSSLAACLAGFIILLRCGRRYAELLLGLSVCFVGYDLYALIWDATVFPFFSYLEASLSVIRNTLAMPSTVGFAALFVQRNTGRLPKALRLLLLAWFTLAIPLFCANIAKSLLSYQLISPPALSAFKDLTSWASSLVVLATFYWGWHRTFAHEKVRMGWLMAATSMQALMWALIAYGWLTAAAVFFNTSLFILAYAVLRHRVVDFGFVINRAIVFSALSIFMLIAFGFTEWAVDKLLHFEGREKNVIVDAAVAMAIISGFHRVRHWVDHRVDHLFFHAWYRAAQGFRGFLARAEHITDGSVLQERFLQALTDYTGAASASIYMEDKSDGSLQLRQSTLPVTATIIDANDPVMLALRMQRDYLALATDDKALPNGFAIPMVMRGRVSGVVLLSAKANRQDYRPDELELLLTGVQQVALDLEILRVDRLDLESGEIEELRKELRHLTEMNETLQRNNEALKHLATQPHQAHVA